MYLSQQIWSNLNHYETGFGDFVCFVFGRISGQNNKHAFIWRAMWIQHAWLELEKLLLLLLSRTVQNPNCYALHLQKKIQDRLTQCENKTQKQSWVPNKAILSIFLGTNFKNDLQIKYYWFMAGCPKFKKNKN